MPYFPEIARTVADILQFNGVQKGGGCPPSWIYYTRV